MKKSCFIFTFVALFLVPDIAYAAASDLTLVTGTAGENGEMSYSISLQILFFMTLLSMLPAALMSMTSFTRIIVVLAILRQALGLMQTPSNQIIVGLALFTTLFIMAPVFESAYENGIEPYLEESIGFEDALSETGSPFHRFMSNQTREADLALFSEMAGYEEFNSIDEIPFRVLVPAYITSELKTAFQIGFLIFIPFLVIDLVVASILMSMGMMMLSPMLISLPFKIMLFVMVDGWNLVMGTLAASFIVA
ncbi:MAG: flagellar biosynthetic protein FliP [SAR86 cluster bacterium]|uniref:Flagellar biosynthetic protein FliP n=1 Tax=SAR86 cluster bacterium TaxID=2030880 RepID=A0A2A5CA93_9GAMM|nr:MAG: flagellar biosynthetic protein FliP [SAR86 cluster bacterium]